MPSRKKRPEKSPIVRAFAVIALVIEKPRTRQEVSDLLGINYDASCAYLGAMADEGLAAEEEAPETTKDKRASNLFRWTGSAK